MKRFLTHSFLFLSLGMSLGAYQRKCVDIDVAQDVKDITLKNQPASYVYTVDPQSFFTAGGAEDRAAQAQGQGKKRKCFVFMSFEELTHVKFELDNYADDADLLVQPLSGVAQKMVGDLLQQNADMKVGTLKRLVVDAIDNSAQ